MTAPRSEYVEYPRYEGTPCKTCGHLGVLHADRVDHPSSTDHCEVCECDEFIPDEKEARA